MAGVPTSAQACKIRINGSTLYNSKWTVTPETTWQDSSNMDGGGFETQIACLRKLTVTVEGWWDYTANMHDAPLTVQDGQSLTNVLLYTRDIGSAFWSLPLASVVSVPMAADVHDLLKYGPLTLKASGTFVYPTG